MSKTFGEAAVGLARLATAPLGAWRRAMARSYAAQRLAPTWAVNSTAGRMVFAGHSGRCLHDAHGFGSDEPETVAWIEAMPAGSVLWDIGANVGVYAVFAAKRGIRVLAFEPNARTMGVLAENIVLNEVSDLVDAYGVALAGRTGLDALYVHAERTDPGHAVHSFGTVETVAGRIDRPIRQAAIGYTIDAFIAAFNAPSPTHIKLDVDGIEAAILSGGGATLGSSVREILVEIYDDMAKDQANDIRAALSAANFLERSTINPAGRNKLFVRAA